MSACKKDPQIIMLKESKLLDIKYGPDSLNTMDLFLPAKRNKSTKVIVFIHGGAWVQGDKTELKSIAEMFLQKGFATILINYRLANDSVHYTEISEDITGAINFIQSHSSEYVYSDKAIGLLGYSAGAQLALMQAYNNTAIKIKAVCAVSAPSDLCNPFYQSGMITGSIEKYVNCTYTNNPAIWQANSPYYFVSKNSPPTYLFHGTQDLHVDINDSRKLYQKLKSLGVKSLLQEIEANHGLMLYLRKEDYTPMIDWMSKMMK